MKKLTIVALVGFVSALLAACGGGGGGGGGSSTTSYSAACSDGTLRTSTISSEDAALQCPSSASTIITSVPIPSYLANSEERAAFDLFNNERGNCGFGKVKENTFLNTAAANHARYLVLNNEMTHYESASKTGFTGVDPYSRVTAAGYASNYPNYPFVGEDASPSKLTTYVGTGALAIRSLFSSPYHGVSMVRGQLEMGISILDGSQLISQSTYYPTVINFGVGLSQVAQLPSSSTVLTYPCEGTNGVGYGGWKESPSPVANGVGPWGTPLFIMGRYGNTLVLTSATLTNVATGANVALKTPYHTRNTDPSGNGAYLLPNEGFILPDQPLIPNTQYQAIINGTNNGVAFSRTFKFTTGTHGYDSNGNYQ